MSSDQSDYYEEEEIYNEDDNDLYPPTSGADFWANFGSSINPSIIPPAPNNTEKNFTNSRQTEKVSNSTPSTSNRRQIGEEYAYQDTARYDQSMAINDTYMSIHEWQHICMKMDMRYDNESTCRINDLSAENENLRKRVDKLEKSFAESQEQLNASQEQSNQLQIEKDLLSKKLDDDAELQRKQYAEFSQKHKQIIADLYSEMELLRHSYKTSRNIAFDDAHTLFEQNQIAPAIDQISPMTVPDPIDNPTSIDCQQTFWSAPDHPFDMNEVLLEEEESINRPTSTIIYPSAVSLKENECETNSTVEEARNLDVNNTVVPLTDQASDNVSPLSPEPNKVQTAVVLNSSSNITSSEAPLPISTEIPPLKCAKRPSKQIGSRALAKRSRLSFREQNLPQIQKDNSLVTSIVYVQNQQQSEFGESSDESATDGEESEYEFEQSSDGSESDDDESECGLESETDGETLTIKTRAHYKCKKNRESNKMKVQSNSRQKAPPHSKTKGQGMSNIGLKSAIDGEKRFKCKMCHYVANFKSRFSVHMRRHTGERPFKCKLCNYAASQYSNLIAHERIHSGEKPYKCQLCNYAAAQYSSLVKHEQTHSGEKPYKCGLCKYAAVQNSSLIEHIRIHTGEKPYKCRFCKYASTRSEDLKRHMRSQRHKTNMELHTTSNKKDVERSMSKKSGKND